MLPVPTLAQIIQVAWNIAVGAAIAGLTAYAAGKPVDGPVFATGVLTVIVPLFQRPPHAAT